MYSAKKLTEKVYSTITENWPIHPSGVCRILKIPANVSNISKIKYHFNNLAKQGRIHVKKIDRALVAWPSEIDRIRVIHDLLK